MKYLRFKEHPFLLFNGNPEFINCYGEKIHNEYGFRGNWTINELNEIDKKIYCMGESSTYCAYIERNEDTWAERLGSKLGIKVINGGGSGWTSIQSLMRFITYVDLIKPFLIIIYQGKNDFHPFVNGNLNMKTIDIDYGNVIHPIKIGRTAKILSDFKIFSEFMERYGHGKARNVLWQIYGRKPFTQEEVRQGLGRVSSLNWQGLLSRYKSIVALCKYRGIKVLFVTQKVENPVYEKYMSFLNDNIKGFKDCLIYDFASVKIPKGTLLDTTHFSIKGCDLFSDKLYEFITECPIKK